MAAEELSHGHMEALVRHPAWREYVREYLLPYYANLQAGAAEHPEYAAMQTAVRTVIETPYAVAGRPDPFQSDDWDHSPDPKDTNDDKGHDDDDQGHDVDQPPSGPAPALATAPEPGPQGLAGEPLLPPMDPAPSPPPTPRRRKPKTGGEA